jgi:hypothetical protein
MKYIKFLTVIIALTMEAARTSETSVDIDLTTQQYIPEDSELRYIYFYFVKTKERRSQVQP